VLASGVALTGVFGDAVFLAITVAFFGSAWLLIRACERIAGDDGIPTGRVGSEASATTGDDDRGQTERELVGGRA
jgi:hypothetical protein